MEIFTLLASSFFFFIFFFSTFTLFKRLHFSRKSVPPGPWKLPFIGNIHNLIGSVPQLALHHLALKHGPLMQLQLGQISAVVVSSAHAAKEVMKIHDINFASRPPILAAEILSYGCCGITFAPYSDYWRHLRKICTNELLSAKRVHSFRSLREEVYSDVTEWVASMEGSPLNLSEKLYSSTYCFIATAAVGKINKEQERLVPMIKEGLELAAGFDIAEFYPSVKLFQWTSGLSRKLSRLRNKADAILEDIIHQHREAAATNNDEDRDEDLVDILLKFQDPAQQIPLTTDNIKAVILDMLTAGSETAATTMNWAMAEMVKNPRVFERAQEEARRVFDEEGYVDESRIHQLKYLKAVVKETLRMHPPLPLLLPRKCSQTCEINGYEISADTKIIVNAWAVHRDPTYWENGDCFTPERFLDTNLVDFRGNNFEFIPFGAGRRMCPGMAFGLANVELPLAMFLYYFDWKMGDVVENQEMDMREGFGLTARRKKDLCLVPVIKRPLPLK